MFKDSVLGLLALVGVFLLVTVLAFYDFGMYSFFAPRVTAVQNQVFHESQQYNDGMLANLSDLMLAYHRAKTQDEKDSIAAVVHQQFGRYPKDRMPPDLRNFYESL